MPLLTRIAAVLAAACLAAAGCGGGSSGDEDAIKTRVNGFYDAFAAKDAGKVCASLAPAQRKQITKTRTGRGPRTCRQAVAFAFLFIGNAGKQAKDAKVTKVEIKGDRARATVELKGRRSEIGLSKVGEDWLISSFNLQKL